jgi:uncharacterized protein
MSRVEPYGHSSLSAYPTSAPASAVPWPTIMGFLRIATHPAIFPNPYSPEEAGTAITGLIDRPNVRTPSEQDGFWGLYRSTADHQTRGNHVPDAHLAALMRQHGVTVIYTVTRQVDRRLTGRTGVPSGASSSLFVPSSTGGVRPCP